MSPVTHRGHIYREFPCPFQSWWRADCTCGWTEWDLTAHEWAMGAFGRHLRAVRWGDDA